MRNQPDENNVVVIGAGLGGLAASCTLSARGYRVTVVEKNKWLGGKAAVRQKGSFRFDMGPTILTMPSVLRRVFAESNERLEDHLELIELDPQWRSFFEDGSRLDLVSDTEEMAQRIAEYSHASEDGQRYADFMQLSEKLDDISQRFFFWKSIGGLGDMFSFRNTFDPATLRDVLSMRMGRTVAGTMRSFVRDERVAQMLDHFTQYVGSAPDSSPAVLCGIAHMQTHEGVWYPSGGIGAVAEALESLAVRNGVEFRLGCGVRRILADKGRVAGVELDDGSRIEASAVVSNSDAVRTHRELLAGSQESAAFERRRKYEPACSGVVLYLGLNRRYDHLLHHNFVFSKDPEEEFESIYRRGEPAEDPTCYVCAPSGSDPTVAPAGGEALYVLTHTPYLRPHHDWRRMFPEYRTKIIEKLKRVGGMPDLESRIVVEEALTPQDIHERYRVLNGAIYGLASHGRFLGAFKPGNRTALKGLYLCGGAAHPGPGMPMVLMSGWIAADALDRDGLGKVLNVEIDAAVA